MALDWTENPAAYDKPFFNGAPMPGTVVRLIAGGNRKNKVEQQTSPTAIGSFTQVGIQEPAFVTYQIECTSKEERDSLGTWLKWLGSQRDKRPAPKFSLVDPRIEHNNLSRVVIGETSPLKDDPRTKKRTVDVTFNEYKPKVENFIASQKHAPKSENEKIIEKLQAELDRLTRPPNKGK